MAAPIPPSRARRDGLRRARWVAAGASVGATVLLTGTIAMVNAAPHDDGASGSVDARVGEAVGADEYADATPFAPQPSPAVPSAPAPSDRIRSGAS